MAGFGRYGLADGPWRRLRGAPPPLILAVTTRDATACAPAFVMSCEQYVLPVQCYGSDQCSFSRRIGPFFHLALTNLEHDKLMKSERNC